MKTYQNDHVSLRVEGGMHLLQQVWTGLPSTENFTDGALTTLVLAKRHHIKRWLIDLRTLRLFNPTDLYWFVQSWLPRASDDLPKGGRVAIVLTDFNQFGKLGTDLVLRASTAQNPALTSRYFLSEEDARQWLMQPGK